jgi:hypothetical protein
VGIIQAEDKEIIHMDENEDIVEVIDDLIYHTEDAPDLCDFCSLLEDAANEIRRLRGQPEKPKQY